MREELYNSIDTPHPVQHVQGSCRLDVPSLKDLRYTGYKKV
jgi:hypothetical protein